VAIPRFGSVGTLRQALRDFQKNPAAYRPEPQTQEVVLERLFHKGDGKAAQRVAAAVLDALNGAMAVRAKDDSLAGVSFP
jgi:hypothetical protein